MNVTGNQEVPFHNQTKEYAMNRSIKRRNSRGARRSILGWIILSIACTFGNVFIGHRRVNFFRRQQWHQHQHNHLPPRSHNESEAISYAGQRNLHEDEKTFDGEYITRILLGEKPFSRRFHRLKYRPGELKMSSTEAIQKCFVDKTHYQNHMKNGNSVFVSVSKRHRLIYRTIPKSASSSARYAMEEYFHGEDVRMNFDRLEDIVRRENHALVSFIREPLDRFYSSYDESFYRMGPWQGEDPVAKRRPMVAKWYHESKHKVMDKYSYLYENMRTLDDYHRSYCAKEILYGGRNYLKECNEAQSVDNGTLVQRFEQFVDDYDGLNPFDVHLNLQVPSLVDGRNGEPLPFSMLYNASEAEKGWQHIADTRGVKLPKHMKVGRKTSRRFNLAMVSNATKRKICRILALDYCCLNIELPEVCKADETDGVYCMVEKKTMHREDPRTKEDGVQRLIIAPWTNA